jgi:site-specific recombinase XerD
MTHTRRFSTFASLVQEFFCQRLVQQQNASTNTVAAYRDTFRLLLRFLQQRKHKAPANVLLTDLDAITVLAFLDDLERHRGNTIRTRNARLAALRSFMKYAASRDPTALPIAQRVLAIPMKRFDLPLLGYLTREEVKVIVEAPDQTTWSGRRDRALLTVLYNTGMRVSEAIGLHRADVLLHQAPAVQIRGKGRKRRQVPLWKPTATLLIHWLKEIHADAETPLFPNRHGQALSRSGIEERLQQAVAIGTRRCSSLSQKQVSPHTFRHTTAMHLLQAGVDVTVIALWLGHASPETTHQYVEADLTMKQHALERLEELPVNRKGYRVEERLLQFLDGL